MSDVKAKTKQIFEHYGAENQIAKTIEELTELSMALQKYQLASTEENAQNVCEEMADVFIMLEQMSYVFSRFAVEEWIEYKVNRTIDSIGGE